MVASQATKGTTKGQPERNGPGSIGVHRTLRSRRATVYFTSTSPENRIQPVADSYEHDQWIARERLAHETGC
jgi:hypothetical protein